MGSGLSPLLSIFPPGQCFSPWRVGGGLIGGGVAIPFPRDIWGCIDRLMVTVGSESVLLPSSGERPGMLLKSCNRKARPPKTKNCESHLTLCDPTD